MTQTLICGVLVVMSRVCEIWLSQNRVIFEKSSMRCPVVRIFLCH